MVGVISAEEQPVVSKQSAALISHDIAILFSLVSNVYLLFSTGQSLFLSFVQHCDEHFLHVDNSELSTQQMKSELK